MKDDRTNINLSDWGLEATDADTSTEGKGGMFPL